MSKQVRILVVTNLDGNEYQPNDVVELANKTAKALCDAGFADMTPEALKYCLSDLGAQVKAHVVGDDAEIEQK
jgi:hypothetical protein